MSSPPGRDQFDAMIAHGVPPLEVLAMADLRVVGSVMRNTPALLMTPATNAYVIAQTQLLELDLFERDWGAEPNAITAAEEG